MDWRFLAGGGAILSTGIIIAAIFGALVTSGPLEELNQNRGIAQFGGLISGIGFILMLVSFGFNRRRKTKPGKGMPTKPDEPS